MTVIPAMVESPSSAGYTNRQMVIGIWDDPAMNAANQNGKLMIDMKGVAELLGCCEKTVRRLKAAGRLPRHAKLGRRVLWPRAEILAWIAASCPNQREWAARRAEEMRKRGA